MISIRRVSEESRPRDRKRNRLLLTVGDESWHITREEAKKLKDQLGRFKL